MLFLSTIWMAASLARGAGPAPLEPAPSAWAGAACDFGSLSACPLETNRSARYDVNGAVDVGFDLHATGGPVLLYLLTESAFATYLATGAALPLADTCAPTGFSDCTGQVGVYLQGPLYAVLEAAGPPANVSGHVAVTPRAGGTSLTAVYVAVAVVAALAIAVVCWVVCRRKSRQRAGLYQQDLESPA